MVTCDVLPTQYLDSGARKIFGITQKENVSQGGLLKHIAYHINKRRKRMSDTLGKYMEQRFCEIVQVHFRVIYRTQPRTSRTERAENVLDINRYPAGNLQSNLIRELQCSFTETLMRIRKLSWWAHALPK